LIVNGGELAPPFAPLPSGQPCPTMPMNTPPPPGGGGGTGSKTVQVDAKPDPANQAGFGFSFSPANVAVNKGDSILFKNTGSSDPHSVIWDSPNSPSNGPLFNAGNTWSVVMPNAGTFNYHCGVHGAGMKGTVTVT
jgi:plastocyanin